jgi:hypothetical protein
VVCGFFGGRGKRLMLDSELLKDESSEIDVVGPTLPALKTMLELPVLAIDTKEKYRQLVHGLLSACLLNVDAMGWVGPSSEVT